MAEPTPTYHVLDANQPNPDKAIADAARAAMEPLLRIFVRDESTKDVNKAPILWLLRAMMEQEIGRVDLTLAEMDATLARIDVKLDP